MGGQLPTKGQNRRERILEVLKQQGRLSVQDIVSRFGCSEATARRDLDLLESEAHIIRTMGGALYDGLNPVREASFSERKSISWAEKERIASRAASFVQEGDIIGLSGGTTVFLIAKALKTRSGITVVTNAVNVAMELADSEGIQVVVTGGIMRNKSFELCGPLAEKMLESLNIGKMFLGIDGLAVAQGATTYSELEAQAAKMLMKRSQETYAVFDHTKVDRASLFSIAPLSAFHACITDSAPSEELAIELKKQEVALYIGNE